MKKDTNQKELETENTDNEELEIDEESDEEIDEEIEEVSPEEMEKFRTQLKYDEDGLIIPTPMVENDSNSEAFHDFEVNAFYRQLRDKELSKEEIWDKFKAFLDVKHKYLF